MRPSNILATDASPQTWQVQVEQGLEAGRTPLLALGVSQRLLDGWAAHMALDRCNQTRTDVVTPTLLIGGTSVLWPVILLHPTVPTVAETALSAMTLLYGGADQATYMASVTTVGAERLLAGGLRTTDLPASMHPGLVPLTNQGPPLPWSALGLSLSTLPPPVAPTLMVRPPVPSVDAWLAWSVLGLVVLLVLLALFI